MRWSGATGAIARCKRVSIGCGHKCRSVPAWPWICGVKPKPKAVNKPSPHSIVHGLDKPGVFTTDSGFSCCQYGKGARTVRVDGIRNGGDEILPHDHTVEGHRHEVCPGAISIERMIAGDREQLLLDQRVWSVWIE